MVRTPQQQEIFLRFIDAQEIRRVLTFPVLIDAIEASHRRPKIDVQDGMLGSEGEQYFVRHAVDRGRFMGSKLITSFPTNLEGGELPAIQALSVLFDGTNGKPLAWLPYRGPLSLRLQHLPAPVLPQLQPPAPPFGSRSAHPAATVWN